VLCEHSHTCTAYIHYRDGAGIVATAQSLTAEAPSTQHTSSSITAHAHTHAHTDAHATLSTLAPQHPSLVDIKLLAQGADGTVESLSTTTGVPSMRLTATLTGPLLTDFGQLERGRVRPTLLDGSGSSVSCSSSSSSSGSSSGSSGSATSAGCSGAPGKLTYTVHTTRCYMCWCMCVVSVCDKGSCGAIVVSCDHVWLSI
jgi:hypothetical protein